MKSDRRPVLQGESGLMCAVIRQAVKDYQRMRKRGEDTKEVRDFLFGDGEISVPMIVFSVFANEIDEVAFAERVDRELMED